MLRCEQLRLLTEQRVRHQEFELLQNDYRSLMFAYYNAGTT